MNPFAALAGAMKGPTSRGAKPNDGSPRAQRQSEYEAAAGHYAQVQKSTNDKAELDKAHGRLMAATAALAQDH